MKRFIPLGVGLLLACSKQESGETSQSPAGTSHAYATDFPRTEQPISEGGRWVNGGATGDDWTDVSTTPGRAIGHQTGAIYTDATAILGGTWTPDGRLTATVFTSGVVADECFSEVELRLRSRIAPHSNTGYEITFKVSETAEAYLIIVRWDGALGNFTYLLQSHGAQYGVKNGDVVSATMVGNLITAYKNGVEMGHASDGVFPSGSPGIGFSVANNAAGCAGTNDRYGFSSFTVADVVTP